MKNITLIIFSLIFTKFSFGQTLNQDASWPNTEWALTGTFSSAGLLSDPTLTSNFSYDDDAAGSGSTDEIQAQSPIIDLTAASNAGETWIQVSHDYVNNEEYGNGNNLSLEYYDADSSSWLIWGNYIPDNSTATADYCSSTPSTNSSSILDISSFTSTQLSGFMYRISYSASGDWTFGFCSFSPTISSQTPPSCVDVSNVTYSNITATSAEISWTSDDSSFNIEVVDVTAGGTATGTATYTGVTSPYQLSGLSSNNEYEVYVQTDCGSGETSDWVSVSFSTLNSASCGETVTYTQVANGDYTIMLTGGNPAMVTVNGDLEANTWSGGCYDYIYVRDGSGNLLNTEQSCGIFEDVTYTSTDGTISVQITNDGSTQNGDISLQFACEMPSCIAPTDLSVSSVTADSAELSWTSDGTLFNIEYGPSGFTQGDGTSDTSTTASYDLSGLNSGSAYDVYVQTDCGSGETSDWRSISFSTPNSASCGETVTYTQVANGDYTIMLTGGNPAMVTVNGDLEANTWSGGCYDYIYVRDGSGNLLNTEQSCGIFEDVTYTSTDGTISVQITNDGSTQNGDISLQFACEMPSCIAPTDLAVSDVTIDGATIAWTSDGALFNIEYGPAGFTQGDGTSDTSTVASYDLSGLNSGSPYDVYVQTDCGATDGTSDWKSISVSTLVTNDSCDTATVLDALPFTSNGDATGATNNDGFVDCGIATMNDGVWYTFTPTVSGTIELILTPTGWDAEIAVYTGSCGVFTCVDNADGGYTSDPESLSIAVTSGTQYYVNLGHYGSTTDGSEGVYEFRATSTDASLGIEEASMAQFTYFPNPVNDVLTIKAQNSVEDVKVFNMLGQMVLHQNPNSRDCTVDLSAMQSGAYFVQVSIDNTLETVRVLKK